jgi:hypothetical protein
VGNPHKKFPTFEKGYGGILEFKIPENLCFGTYQLILGGNKA